MKGKEISLQFIFIAIFISLVSVCFYFAGKTALAYGILIMAYILMLLDYGYNISSRFTKKMFAWIWGIRAVRKIKSFLSQEMPQNEKIK